jgi:hypothetical protein
VSITNCHHPSAQNLEDSWRKWRAAYEGGDYFIEEYLKKFSDKESDADFAKRKQLTPVPAHAASAIDEVKNSIFQRMIDVQRKDGTPSYMDAVAGLEGGVDLHGRDMNTFLGEQVIAELLVMARVGVFIDMPPLQGPTLADSYKLRPYLYRYRAEQIQSWCFVPGKIDEFQSVLLCDRVDKIDEASGLPCGAWNRWRHCWLEDGLCHVRFFNDQDKCVDMQGRPYEGDYILPIPFIPFVCGELTESLMKNVANHQVALLNMESSDVNYAIFANYPRYVEQSNPGDYGDFFRPNSEEGTAAEAGRGRDKEIKSGVIQGRQLAIGADAKFIHPSSEPITASMEKQKALKEDIRSLIHLSLSNVKGKMASAESKGYDQQGLEAGLSYVGLELQRMERKAAFFWAALENAKQVAQITYPRKWQIQSDADRRADAEHLRELRDDIPSRTYQRSISKQIALTMLSDKVTPEELEKINSEIEAAEGITGDPEVLAAEVTAGILDHRRAAVLAGHPEEAAKDAEEEHIRRATEIAVAQADATAEANQARGVDDLSANPNEGKEEKAASRDTTMEADTTPRVRGAGK